MEELYCTADSMAAQLDVVVFCALVRGRRRIFRRAKVVEVCIVTVVSGCVRFLGTWTRVIGG